MENNIVHKWVKSDINHNHTLQNVHQALMQNVDKEQSEESAFVFHFIDDFM